MELEQDYNLVKEVEDSTYCMHDTIYELVKCKKIGINDLSEILIHLDDIWRIISENN